MDGSSPHWHCATQALNRSDPRLVKIYLLLVVALLLTAVMPASAAAPKKKPIVFTEDEVRAHDAIATRMDEMTVPLLPRLRRAYPGQKRFTEHEIAALDGKGKMVDFDYKANPVNQKGRPPRDTFSVQDANEYLAYVQKRDQAADDYRKALKDKYGRQDYYSASQLRDVEENGAKPMQIEGARDEDDPVLEAEDRIQRRPNGFFEGFRSPRIRESWRDVLFEEDPSQPENKKLAIDDLVGATFSFTHDRLDDTDTWKALGALILPWQYERGVAGGWWPERVALAPSVGINKVDVSSGGSGDTDQMTYRMGVYANWRFPTRSGSGVELRGAGVYVSDTEGEAELPGFEFELEPRWRLRYFPIGYRQVLIPKAAVKADGSDISALEYQLRIWLHAEGGQIQHNGETWNALEEDFFRLGPVAQLTVAAPYLVFGRELSITARYSYLAAVEGTSERPSYFNGTAGLNLYHNPRLGHRISLNLSYQRGGLNFTKEKVDTLTLGLGVLF